uniref:Peptidoglycan-recognition protein n=1 Tax=Lygus hesperus TaxID=30085 RepID=A0A0K8TH54_LYGHE
MASFLYIVFACVLASIAAHPSPTGKSYYSYPFNYVSRDSWGARPPNGVTPLNLPVPYVVVHHSYIPPLCHTEDECKRDMRAMQDAHQLVNGWQDIGYNFAVGGEGSVYEGRGWDVVGAHAVSYNVKSIGICMIGDFVENLPPAAQIQSLRELIEAGVQLGYISPDYKLIGHRQVSATECPGQALFNEISTWDHFTPAL